MAMMQIMEQQFPDLTKFLPNFEPSPNLKENSNEFSPLTFIPKTLVPQKIGKSVGPLTAEERNMKIERYK